MSSHPTVPTISLHRWGVRVNFSLSGLSSLTLPTQSKELVLHEFANRSGLPTFRVSVRTELVQVPMVVVTLETRTATEAERLVYRTQHQLTGRGTPEQEARKLSNATGLPVTLIGVPESIRLGAVQWGRQDCFCRSGCGDPRTGLYGSHGECSPDDGHCACDLNWRGELCDEPYCSSNCSFHGTCITVKSDCESLYGADTEFPCCKCFESFEAPDCAQTRRRLGWAWVSLSDYVGLGSIDNVPGDLGFVMEPVMGHTLVLGRSSDPHKTEDSGSIDMGSRSNTLMIWGGKSQFPPVNEFGFRDRERCLEDYCENEKGRYTIDDRLWSWSPLAGETGFGEWKTGESVALLDTAPERRWLHASARTHTGFFVHGGLSDLPSNNTDIRLSFNLQVGVKVWFPWPHDEPLYALQAFMQQQLDDAPSGPVPARVEPLVVVRRDTDNDPGRNETLARCPLKETGEPDYEKDCDAYDYHALELAVRVNDAKSMARAIDVIGSIDTRTSWLKTDPDAKIQTTTTLWSEFECRDPNTPVARAHPAPSELTKKGCGLRLTAVNEPTRTMRDESIYRPSDVVMPRRKNDLWYFKFSNSTLETTQGWKELVKNRDTALRLGDSPCTFGHAMAVALNRSNQHGGSPFLFGGRIAKEKGKGGTGDGGCAPLNDEGQKRADGVSDTLRKITIEDGQVSWSNLKHKDADLFAEYLRTRFVDVEFQPWMTTKFPAWQEKIKDQFIEYSAATRAALLNEFDEARLKPWKKLMEFDMNGSSCPDPPDHREFSNLAAFHPCNCVPNNYANGLKGWLLDRVRQWQYIRDVEFTLLRNSIQRQETEFLEEVAAVWHEFVCFRWARATLQDLDDLDDIEEGGIAAVCDSTYNPMDGKYTRRAPTEKANPYENGDDLPETFSGSASIANAVHTFQLSTMWKLRQELMRAVHAFLEQLQADTREYTEKVVVGEFNQINILNWNERVLGAMGEWPCHDELQDAVYDLHKSHHYFTQPPPPLPPPSPPPPPTGSEAFVMAMLTSPPPPSPPPPSTSPWDAGEANLRAVDCTADEWSVSPIHSCADDDDCLGLRTCGSGGQCVGMAGDICCDRNSLDREVWKSAVELEENGIKARPWLHVGACEDADCSVCRMHSSTAGTLDFIRSHCPEWDKSVRWWCYWQDRRVAERAPTYWSSLQNWSNAMWQNWTMCADEPDDQCEKLNYPNDIQIEKKLARSNTELRGIAKNAAQASAESMGTDIDAWKQPSALSKLVHKGKPIWMCGLIHQAWGCTPDSVLNDKCFQFDPFNRGTNGAAEFGGFEGPSLDGWHKELSPQQVASMSGGPGYDRFCTFVDAAPDLSPDAAGLPDTIVYANPPGRGFHTLDFEPVEQMLVLFGGTRFGLVENMEDSSMNILDDMWVYMLPRDGVTDFNYGANWKPIHYYSTETQGDLREAKRSAYLAYNGTWFFNWDRELARQLAIRPTQRYGHATAMYTTDLADFGPDHGLGRWREYRQREDYLIEAGMKEPPGSAGSSSSSTSDVASFLFLFGGHNGVELLDDLWVFHFARNPAMKASLVEAEKRLRHSVLSARFDVEKGPYIGWHKLPIKAGADRPPAMFHHRIEYIPDSACQDTASSVQPDETVCVIAGSLYSVGGFQRPLKSSVDGVVGYDDDPNGAGCTAEPDDPDPPKAPCVNEKCCWSVKGVLRDTGGIINGLYRIGNIFNETGELIAERIPHSGARPPARMDQSSAVPQPSTIVPNTRYDKWIFIYGGALGPTHLNTRFSGGDYAQEKWQTTPAPVQLKDKDLWAFDMDQMVWELPGRNAINTVTNRKGKSQSPGGLSSHAAVLTGRDAQTQRPLFYMVVGGRDIYDDETNGVWAYGFESGEWIQLFAPSRIEEGVKIPRRRAGHAALRLEIYGIETLVIYGGLDAFGQALDDFWAFPLAGESQHTWRQMQPRGATPPGRQAPALMGFNEGTFLMFGGQPQIPIKEYEGGEFTGEITYTGASNVLDELWMLQGDPKTSIDEWTWKKVVEDQDSDNNQTLGRYYGYWLGEGRKMRKYRDKPEPRAYAASLSPPCFTDACTKRVWLFGGYSLRTALSDVWTMEEDDFAWRLADTSTKLTPSRFKTSIAVWEPKMANSRNLLPQPHFFTFFGVRDFLGGETVNDIWVFTQVKNTNKKEARNRGSFTSPLAMRGEPYQGESRMDSIADNYAPGWKMEVTGTAWWDNTKPDEPVQVVGPCITGKHDTRPGEADAICMNPPKEVEAEPNSNTG